MKGTPTVHGPKMLHLLERPHGVLEVGPYNKVPLDMVLDGVQVDAFRMFCVEAGVQLTSMQLAAPDTVDAHRYLVDRARASGYLKDAVKAAKLDIDAEADTRTVLAQIEFHSGQELTMLPAGLDGRRRHHALVLSLCGGVDRQQIINGLLAGHLRHTRQIADGEYLLWSDTEGIHTVDVFDLDFSWRAVALMDADHPLLVEVHADENDKPASRRKQLAYPQREQVTVTRFDDLQTLCDVLREASACFQMLTTPDHWALQSPRLQSNELEAAERVTVRFCPGDGDVFRYDTADALRSRLEQLGVDAPDGAEAQLRRALAGRVLEQAGPAPTAFVRAASSAASDEQAPQLERLEALACRTLPRGRFCHPNLNPAEHRLTGAFLPVETFTPLNPFAGPSAGSGS